MNKRTLLNSSILTLSLLPSVGLATACPLPPASIVSEWINCVVNNVLSLVLWPIFLTAVVVMGIWIGFLFLSAKGEPAKIKDATKGLIWLVIGVVVALLAFSAVVTIGKIIGIT